MWAEGAQERGGAWAFIKPNAIGSPGYQHVFEANGVIDIGRAQAAGLLAGFTGDAAPAFYTFTCAVGESAFTPCGFYGNNARYPEFGSFLNRPFEALEFDKRKIKGYERQFGSGFDFFNENEFNKTLAGRLNFGEPYALCVRDLIFLTLFDAQNACQVVGVLALYDRLTVRYPVCKETPPRHVQLRYRMIALLRGTLVEKHPNQVILDVGGVGYDVTVPISTYSKLAGAGSETRLRIYTHVREDTLALYGFLTRDEKNLFEKLIGVSSVGPTLAIKVLSGMDAIDLQNAIRRGEIEKLIRIPGVGKKTAERIVLELRDKLPAPEGGDQSPAAPSLSALDEDVLSGLLNLGCARPAAETAIRKARASGVPDEFEPLFRKALEMVR
jgi:holliday junction DNA helicase RuvA